MVRTSSCFFIPFCPVNREGPAAGPTDGWGPEDKDVPIGTTLFWTLSRGLLPTLSEAVTSAWTLGPIVRSRPGWRLAASPSPVRREVLEPRDASTDRLAGGRMMNLAVCGGP